MYCESNSLKQAITISAQDVKANIIWSRIQTWNCT